MSLCRRFFALCLSLPLCTALVSACSQGGGGGPDGSIDAPTAMPDTTILDAGADVGGAGFDAAVDVSPQSDIAPSDGMPLTDAAQDVISDIVTVDTGPAPACRPAACPNTQPMNGSVCTIPGLVCCYPHPPPLLGGGTCTCDYDSGVVGAWRCFLVL